MKKESMPKIMVAVAVGLRSISKSRQVFMFLILMISCGQSWAQTSPAVAITGQSAQQELANRKVKYYVCPMDPEVRSRKHGKCPKCGMDLRLEPADKHPADNAGQNPESDKALARRDASPEANFTDAPDSSRQASGTTKRMVLPDVEVLDQNGNELHFYSDLIKGKTVAINFIFTNCTTICPPLAATFARVQKEMGDKVGRDVHFISISVDPVTDTPERLKAWGAKFKAGAGWTFVTGDKQEIGKLLSALGASVARREDHSPTVIIGNDTQGVWKRTYGLAKVSQMTGLILKVMAGKIDETLTEEVAKP